MKKLLALVLGFGLTGQQALAVTTVQGNTFAGYADTLISKSTNVLIETGEIAMDGSAVVSTTLADVRTNITDLDEGSWVSGYNTGDNLDLAFNMGVVNGDGVDLSIFFVGGDGHTVDLTIGGQKISYSLLPDEGATGKLDTLYEELPIVRLDINLDDFTSLTGPFTDFNLMIGDRWCGDPNIPDDQGTCSSLPSFVGANYVVPVPAAIWLFGSGLIGLVGLAKRNKKA